MRIALLALMLSGCVTPQPWVKQGSSADQTQQDIRECDYDASKATAAIINPFDKGWENGVMFRKCMEVRGYRR